MNIKVNKITLVTGRGADCLMMELDLPPSIWPFKDHPNVSMEIARGQGKKYVEENFQGVPVNIVEA